MAQHARCTDLIDRLKPLAVAGNPHGVTYGDVVHDSRNVTPGALFVALAGEYHDGHRYIPMAIEQGAVCIVGTLAPVSLAATTIDCGQTLYLQVDDSRRALAIAAAHLYAFPSRAMPVIGVTGTDGKTSTCTLIESILVAASRSPSAPAGRVGVITTVGARIHGKEQDTGFHVTTPDAPDVQRYLAVMRAQGSHFGVIESTSHGLHQGRVAAVDFDVAAVTNITHEHLDYHGTREAYVAAKALLFRALFASPLKPGIPRVAVLNGDDSDSYAALRSVLADMRAQSDVPVITRTYGLHRDATEVSVWADAIAYTPASTRFVVHWWGGSFPVDTTLIGEFNVYNILCATTVALALGIAPAAVQEGIAALAGIPGRMERIDVGQDFLALVDFAHSPASLERALQTLRQVLQQGNADGRMIAVFGSAGLRDRAKRRLMGQISGRLADFTVVTAEDPRTEDLNAINQEIAAGLRDAGTSTQFAIVPDRADAIRFAVNMAQSGDVVAAFGKGHERSMCFGETEYPWSDQVAMVDALTAAMAQRGLRHTGSVPRE